MGLCSCGFEGVRCGRGSGKLNNRAVVHYRGPDKRYQDIAEAVIPAVLVEDDCRSIGGEWQMTIPHVRTDIRRRIHSIVMREFAGIDHLPDSPSSLLEYKYSKPLKISP
jgi:hypothetical protein